MAHNNVKVAAHDRDLVVGPQEVAGPAGGGQSGPIGMTSTTAGRGARTVAMAVARGDIVTVTRVGREPGLDGQELGL